MVRIEKSLWSALENLTQSENDGEAYEPLIAYFREIESEPRLTEAEEVALMRAVDAGLKAQAYMLAAKERGTQICERERAALTADVQAGEKASDTLVRANLGLASRIAINFAGCGVPLEDLVQEANVALVKAAKSGTPANDVRFRYYAYHAIYTSVKRATIHDDWDKYSKSSAKKIERAREELRQDFKREPTAVEVSRKSCVKFETVFALQAISLEPVSLDAPADEDTSESLADLLQDKQSPTLFEIYQDNALRERLAEVLATLTPREQKILKLRFGIGCSHYHTNEELAAMFNLSVPRIGQIEKRALRMLRHPMRSKQLKEFL